MPVWLFIIYNFIFLVRPYIFNTCGTNNSIITTLFYLKENITKRIYKSACFDTKHMLFSKLFDKHIPLSSFLQGCIVTWYCMLGVKKEKSLEKRWLCKFISTSNAATRTNFGWYNYPFDHTIVHHLVYFSKRDLLCLRNQLTQRENVRKKGH